MVFTLSALTTLEPTQTEQDSQMTWSHIIESYNYIYMYIYIYTYIYNYRGMYWKLQKIPLANGESIENLRYKLERAGVVVAHALIPALRRQRQVDLC